VEGDLVLSQHAVVINGEVGGLGHFAVFAKLGTGKIDVMFLPFARAPDVH